MRDALFALVMLPLIPSALVAPYVGILAWHLISLMNPHRLTWGFANDFPWAMLAAAATLLGWLASREPKRIPVTATTGLMMLFMTWLTVTTWQAQAPELAWPAWDRTMKILLMALVTVPLMLSRERLQALIWVAVVSLGFYGVKGAIFTVMTGGQFRVQGPPSSFIGDNNDLALAMVMTLPLLVHLYHTTRPGWMRKGIVAAIPLMVISILFTYSRGGLIGLAVVLALLLLRMRGKAAIGGLLFLGLAFALPFAPEQWVERMASIADYEQDQSAAIRLRMWGMAWRIAEAHPVFGGGFEVFLDPAQYPLFLPEAEHARDVHSAYFQVLGEHGFPGLALFVLLGLATWRAAGWVARRAAGRADLAWAGEMATMCRISLAGYAVCASFLTLAFYDYLYLIVAVVTCLRLVVARKLAGAGAGAATPAGARGAEAVPG